MNNLQIEYFMEVAMRKSFSKAAEALYITQPAISRAVNSLESELGVLLFDRTGKKVALSEAGEMYLKAFVKIKQILSDTAYELESLARMQRGEVRVGFISGWNTSGFIPDFLRKFRDLYPNVSSYIKFMDIKQLRDDLYSNNLDIIVTIRDSIQDIDSRALNLNIKKLTSSSRILLYSSQNPIAKAKESLTVLDFKEALFLVEDDGTNHPINIVKSYCAPYKFSPKVQMVKTMEDIISGIQNSNVVAILEEWSRECNNQMFSYLKLDQQNDIIVAWQQSNKNPVIPNFVSELILCFKTENMETD